MILNLLFFLTFTFIVAMFGVVGIKTIETILRKKIDLSKTHTIDFILLGLIFLTIFIRIVFFFSKIDLRIFLLSFLIGLGILVKYKKEIKQKTKTILKNIFTSKIDILLLVIIMIYASYQAAKIPMHYDIDLYHSSIIRWIENYRIIPGVANLHSRFGFIGSWHFLSAMSSFTNILAVPIHAMNGWIQWIFISFLLTNFIRSIKTKVIAITTVDLTKIFLITFILFSDVIKWDISSPITDIPIILLTWLTFYLFLEKNNNAYLIRKVTLCLLPIFLISVKLSAIPLLLITVVQLFSKNITRPFRAIILGFSTLILSIIILTNIVTSGYLLYPFPYMSISSLKWTSPKEVAAEESDWIKSWAISPGLNKDVVLNYSFFERITLWFNTLNKIEISFLLLLCTLLLLVAKKYFFSNEKINLTGEKEQVLLISFIGSLFWFVMAPDFRFGWGFLVFFLFSLFLLFFEEKKLIIDSNMLRIVKNIIALLIIVNLISSLIISSDFSEEIKEKLVTPRNYRICKVKEQNISGLIFFTPYDETKTDQTCWNGFPGTPNINENFYTLGNTYLDGFAISGNNAF